MKCKSIKKHFYLIFIFLYLKTSNFMINNNFRLIVRETKKMGEIYFKQHANITVVLVDTLRPILKHYLKTHYEI